MFQPYKRPKQQYSWRKFWRASLGLVIGLGLSALIVWLINVVFKDSFDWSLGLTGVFVFFICPFFVQWIMNKCRHPDDVSKNGYSGLFRIFSKKKYP